MTGIAIAFGVDGHAELRLTPECLALREQLGLTGWVALEALVLAATLDATGAVTVAASARDLAGRLGIGKDRAAASLGMLRDAGLLVRTAPSAGRPSRFVAHRYEIRLPVSRAGDTARPTSRDGWARDARGVARDGTRLFDVES